MMEIKGPFTAPLLIICSTWQTWLNVKLKRVYPRYHFTDSRGSFTFLCQQRFKICLTLIETKIIERDWDKQDKLIRTFDTWLIMYICFQTACGKGSWGPDCSNKCHCKDENEICYHVTGSCASGCAERRVGTGCDAGMYVMVIFLHTLFNSLDPGGYGAW